MTVANQPLDNTSSAGQHCSLISDGHFMLAAATLGDTSEDYHHHHHRTSRQGLEHHRLCIIVCIIIREYASKHHHHHSLWHTMSSLPWLCFTVSIHCISHNAELYIASYQHHATISVTICIGSLTCTSNSCNCCSGWLLCEYQHTVQTVEGLDFWWRAANIQPGNTHKIKLVEDYVNLVTNSDHCCFTLGLLLHWSAANSAWSGLYWSIVEDLTLLQNMSLYHLYILLSRIWSRSSYCTYCIVYYCILLNTSSSSSSYH